MVVFPSLHAQIHARAQTHAAELTLKEYKQVLRSLGLDDKMSEPEIVLAFGELRGLRRSNGTYRRVDFFEHSAELVKKFRGGLGLIQAQKPNDQQALAGQQAHASSLPALPQTLREREKLPALPQTLRERARAKAKSRRRTATSIGNKKRGRRLRRSLIKVYIPFLTGEVGGGILFERAPTKQPTAQPSYDFPLNTHISPTGRKQRGSVAFSAGLFKSGESKVCAYAREVWGHAPNYGDLESGMSLWGT